MRIYWYWPFPHLWEAPLAEASVRPGDSLTLHSLDTRLGIRGELAGTRFDVLPELPDASRDRSEGSPAWLTSRAMTYFRRAQLRSRVVAQGNFDVCHIHSLLYFTDGVALRRLRRRLPIVSNVHDVVPHQARVPSPLERRLLRMVYDNAGTLVVAHERLRAQLAAEFDVDASRVEVIPLPISPVKLDGDRRDGPPTALFFGNFRRNKGVPVLLEAIRRLRHLRDARFHFAGRGAGEIEQQIRAAAARDDRITADIRFIDPDDKDALYRAATVAVLPYTTFASQSGVLSDAYAYQLPAIVTDVGALGDTVRSDGSGWVVPPGDPDALAEALAAAILDPAQREQRSAAATRVAACRTPEIVGASFRALYDRVAGARANQRTGG